MVMDKQKNSKEWRSYPNEVPTECGMYRVEYEDRVGVRWYSCWYWDEDAFVEQNFKGCLVYMDDKSNIRFKPWDD